MFINPVLWPHGNKEPYLLGSKGPSNLLGLCPGRVTLATPATQWLASSLPILQFIVFKSCLSKMGAPKHTAVCGRVFFPGKPQNNVFSSEFVAKRDKRKHNDDTPTTLNERIMKTKNINIRRSGFCPRSGNECGLRDRFVVCRLLLVRHQNKKVNGAVSF